MPRPCNIMVFGLCVLFAMDTPLVGQVPQEAELLKELIDRAVDAEEAAYGDAREAILLRGAAAVPLLERMQASEDRQRRIIAEGMLGWIREPEVNRRRQELLRVALVNATRMLTGPINGIIAGEIAPPGTEVLQEGMMMRPDVSWVTPLGRDDLRRNPAAPFLLELILKGAIGPASPTEIERATERRKNQLKALCRNPDYGLWARCYAAVLVGRLDHPDVVSVLTNVLRTSEHPELRACAAAGLHNTGSDEAVEALVEAMSDSDRSVRRRAYYALRDITGQDFGQEQEKYRNWWEQNKAHRRQSTRERTR